MRLGGAPCVVKCVRGGAPARVLRMLCMHGASGRMHERSYQMSRRRIMAGEAGGRECVRLVLAAELVWEGVSRLIFNAGAYTTRVTPATYCRAELQQVAAEGKLLAAAPWKHRRGGPRS